VFFVVHEFGRLPAFSFEGTVRLRFAYHLLRVLACGIDGEQFRAGRRTPDSGSVREGIMFCDGCGTAVQPGQAFCATCGKQIVGTVAVMPARRSRVQEHVHFVGILWLAISAFNAVGGVVLYILANTLFAPGSRAGAPLFLHPLLATIAIFVLGKAALGFIAGWGLMQREGWARVLALVLAFISLFNIPFGTAIGVYTMWVLLPENSEEEYQALAAGKAA